MISLLCACSLSLSSPVLPAASLSTPSEAEQLEEFLDTAEELDDFDVQQFFYDYFNSLAGGPSFATPSEANYQELDIDEPIEVYPAEELMSVYADVLDSPDVNCVWYHVEIDNREYDLCFPKSDADSLWVSDSGYLYNVGTSDITGRIIDGDIIPSSKAYDLVILGSVLRDNMSDIYEYNSYNELRSYYWSGNRKFYTSSWVHIKVLDVTNTYQTSSYLTYIIIFLLGGGLICLLKKSLR